MSTSDSIELGRELLSSFPLLDPAIERVHPADASRDAPMLRLLCTHCWCIFEGWGRPVCQDCAAPRPPGGWASLPYTFRDRYVFWKQLGRGGMGSVFLAYDEQQAGKERKPVAVKVVPRTNAPAVREMLRRMFEREAAAAAMLAQSPYFVRVTSHDVGVEPAYLVMEHVDWPTLRHWLKPAGKVQPLPPVKVARIGVAILRGVATMHFHRIVHRDLKPENIFVRRAAHGDDYEVKILDLGVWTQDVVTGPALAPSVRGPVVREENGPVGTYSYMSPEQMAGKPVGAQSDLHSVGSVLWELATGRLPYRMKPGDEQGQFKDRLSRLPVPPERPPYMPDGLYDLLVRALAFELSHRWDSAEEMRVALKVWVAEELLRSRHAVARAEERLEELQRRVDRIRRRLVPAGDLLDRLDDLSRRLGSLSGHAEEASPSALLDSLEDAGGRLQEVEAAIARFQRGLEPSRVERGLEHLGIRKLLAPTRPELPALSDFAIEVMAPVSEAELLDVVPDAGGPPPEEEWPLPSLSNASQIGEITAPPRRRSSRLLLAGALALASVLVLVIALLPLTRQSVAPVGWAPFKDGLSRLASRLAPRSATSSAEHEPAARALTLPPEVPSPGSNAAIAPPAKSPALSGARSLLDLAVERSNRARAEAAARGEPLERRRTGGGVLGLGHSAGLTAVAFAPTGHTLASAGSDFVVNVWRADTGAVVRRLLGHEDAVRALAWSPDGRLLASAGDDAAIRWWDVETGRIARSLFGHDGAVRALAFSPDGRRLLSAGDDGDLRIWSVESGTLERSLRRRGDAKIESLSVAPDSRAALVVLADGAALIWDLDRGVVLRAIAASAHRMARAAFSSDGKAIVSAGRDETARIEAIDASAKPSSLRTLRGHDGDVLDVAVSSDGRRVATSGADKTIRVWLAATGRLVRVISGLAAPIERLSFSSGSNLIAAGAADGSVQVFETSSGRLKRSHGGRDGPIGALAVRPSGDWIALGGAGDGVVDLVNPSTGERVGSLRGHRGAVRALAFSPDGRTLGSAGSDATLRLWDLTGTAAPRAIEAHSGPVRALGFSPVADRTEIASGGEDGLLRIWDSSSGRLLRSLSLHRGALHALAYASDGRRLVTSGDDGTASVVDPSDGRVIRRIEAHAGPVLAVAISADGQRVVTGGADRAIKVWRAESGKLVAVYEGHARSVRALAMLGDRIASASADQTIRLWHPTDPPLVLSGHDLAVLSLAHLPGGDRLASGGIDSTLRLWDPGTGTWVAIAPGDGTPAVFDRGGRLDCAAGTCR